MCRIKVFRSLIILLFVNYAPCAILTANNDADNSLIERSIESIMDTNNQLLDKLQVLKKIDEFLTKNKQPDEPNALRAIEEKLSNLQNTAKNSLENNELLLGAVDKINGNLVKLQEAPHLERQIKSLKDTMEKLPSSDTLNTKFDAMAKWALDTRLNADENLKVINKLPEALKKINDRLDDLDILLKRKNEFTDRKNEFTNNDQALGDEPKKEKIDLDEMDKTKIGETGCKFLTLNNGDLETFDMDKTSLPNMTFETYFAIRSSKQIQIMLWEENKPDLTSNKLRPDFMIDIGAKDNNNLMMTSMTVKGELWKKETPTILRADRYQKFYIKMYNDSIELGTSCNLDPLHIHQTRLRGSIVTMGILSYGNEAKILKDCPAKTCCYVAHFPRKALSQYSMRTRRELRAKYCAGQLVLDKTFMMMGVLRVIS